MRLAESIEDSYNRRLYEYIVKFTFLFLPVSEFTYMCVSIFLYPAPPPSFFLIWFVVSTVLTFMLTTRAGKNGLLPRELYCDEYSKCASIFTDPKNCDRKTNVKKFRGGPLTSFPQNICFKFCPCPNLRGSTFCNTSYDARCSVERRNGHRNPDARARVTAWLRVLQDSTRIRAGPPGTHSGSNCTAEYSLLYSQRDGVPEVRREGLR